MVCIRSLAAAVRCLAASVHLRHTSPSPLAWWLQPTHRSACCICSLAAYVGLLCPTVSVRFLHAPARCVRALARCAGPLASSARSLRLCARSVRLSVRSLRLCVGSPRLSRSLPSARCVRPLAAAASCSAVFHCSAAAAVAGSAKAVPAVMRL